MAELSPLTYQCLAESGEKFAVPLALILIVLNVEGGAIGLESPNSNGSHDLGPMQINTLWLPKLNALGITRELLRDNGCVNVAVGAWLLRHHLKEEANPFRAVSLYHSRDPERRGIYLARALRLSANLNVNATLARANGQK
ncbi:MAG: lytic transglycosylase domain-containing protein [Deltaproteobacteria bacterium]|jgi:hypothetical protein|nr:lytic transglycosylase domain-containing protein [Deltaproteobacteria bacterium]